MSDILQMVQNLVNYSRDSERDEGEMAVIEGTKPYLRALQSTLAKRARDFLPYEVVCSPLRKRFGRGMQDLFELNVDFLAE